MCVCVFEGASVFLSLGTVWKLTRNIRMSIVWLSFTTRDGTLLDSCARVPDRKSEWIVCRLGCVTARTYNENSWKSTPFSIHLPQANIETRNQQLAHRAEHTRTHIGSAISPTWHLQLFFAHSMRIVLGGDWQNNRVCGFACVLAAQMNACVSTQHSTYYISGFRTQFNLKMICFLRSEIGKWERTIRERIEHASEALT